MGKTAGKPLRHTVDYPGGLPGGLSPIRGQNDEFHAATSTRLARRSSQDVRRKAISPPARHHSTTGTARDDCRLDSSFHACAAGAYRVDSPIRLSHRNHRGCCLQSAGCRVSRDSRRPGFDCHGSIDPWEYGHPKADRWCRGVLTSVEKSRMRNCAKRYGRVVAAETATLSVGDTECVSLV